VTGSRRNRSADGRWSAAVAAQAFLLSFGVLLIADGLLGECDAAREEARLPSDAMSSFATPWSVSREYEVTANDLDAGGSIRDQTVTAWVGEVRDAYLEQCKVLHETCAREGWAPHDRGGPHPTGTSLGHASAVVVTATATEVLPRSFVIAVRIRPGGGDRDDPVNTTCVITLEDATGAAHEIGKDVRDELIALEHAARYFN
jgi:acyl-CoA thioesterase FadM